MTKLEGPYPGKSGRMFVTLVMDDGKRRYLSYARYLMQEHLGRELSADEVVHHLNSDFRDDRIENLEVLDRIEHLKGHPESLEKARAASMANRAPFTHGTLYGWMRKKCDCADCYAAKRAWHDERNARRRSGTRGPYKRRF
jgi:hypothetical protein